ncbi:MAG: Dephospho-CoA kinase-like protein [Candidatus Woesebacteria bacterium GW2011_GWC2_47_16]|uniref:Dephospho-CoA kinase-like protein n=9 Tax=Candidatus Woeseibacteriota TaxID=1752722 RepID=A0A0G1QT33_9BACT|nr:MAG: Dephospho-CoA kinase-like protein [Candidatus Woesebacteria bacterium GW2011_GWE1_45_18]KKU25260.1 MAG: Dephospho-CoA kinase-like protein [Candidatus Woesebacteria bacterium GW2011_GWF1_46_13]KKU48069.1 MAG: Dephospho-CoA kinase-like protein [Candidatus Woesebacteria bacterium GW2011_GWF2_46_8]KKU65243.1 MAG: Dephospho-CoA kinase-like protein [Candidatus Woesebacteria bacterium GW2011_GWC2_47_16]KKU71067.1 MAG: Dephospho-CoA kinase-like protein [Candidatus Woesebacteria bacterium GW2011
MNHLVCITGLPGSGKSIASDFFVKKGFQFLRFGQITLEELKRKKLPLNEKNERTIREGFRKKYGMAAYAILNLPKFKKLLKKGDTVGDGLYSFEEYKVLKNKFGKRFLTIAVYSPPEIRYKRLASRKLQKNDREIRFRPLTGKEAAQRDLSEIENLNKGGTIAMADYTIVNTRTLRYFKKQLNEIYKEIKQKRN